MYNGVQTDHSFNVRNQLIKTTVGDDIIDYGYDKRGNLTDVTENGVLTASYGFDATNMMISAATSKGTAEFVYNGLRKRISKMENLHSQTVIPDPCQEVRYVLDLTRPYDDLLATHDATPQNFIWGNSLLSANTKDDGFHYLHDHLGSPIRLLDNDNSETMAYDEFGVPEIAAAAQCFNNPFGFTGYQTDKISELYYAQARYYSPTSGRFFAEDPIKDRFNWYGYCNANPIGFIDPTGLMEIGNDGWSMSSVRPAVSANTTSSRPAAGATTYISEGQFVQNPHGYWTPTGIPTPETREQIQPVVDAVGMAMRVPAAVVNATDVELTGGIGVGGTWTSGGTTRRLEAVLVAVTVSTNQDKPFTLEHPNAKAGAKNAAGGMAITYNFEDGLSGGMILPGGVDVKDDKLRFGKRVFGKYGLGGGFAIEFDPNVFFSVLSGVEEIDCQ